MTSKCLLFCSRSPPGNLVLWSLQDPRSRIQGPAASHSCARCTVRASNRFCLTPRALCWGWGMALIGGRAAIWLWSWKAQGLNPAMSISVWPRRGYLKPFKTIFFSAIKWRLYYLLLGFLSWVTCLAYNKQLINGRYNLIIAKIVITLCTLLPWIRIDKRNQYMQHGYHSLWQLFRNLPKC